MVAGGRYVVEKKKTGRRIEFTYLLERIHVTASKPAVLAAAWNSRVLATHVQMIVRRTTCNYCGVITALVRPHRGLKFGRELRTPTMQAGLAARRLSFREIFTSVGRTFLNVLIVIDFRASGNRMKAVSAAA